jgi:hypothetical protein
MSALVSLAVCLGLVLAPPLALAAEGTAAYQPESLAAFERQLGSGQIHEATINKRVRSVRLTLKDGQHVLAKYQAHEEPKVLAELKAKGVPVSVLSKTQAIKETKKPVKHKLRYIVGGIAIVVVVVVGAVVLIDRRRKFRD